MEDANLEATTILGIGILEPAPAIDEDALWVDRCKAGDPDAFAPLVRKFGGRIQRLAWGMLREGQNDADDAVQEIFVKAYLALPKFRGDSKFSTWIYRIAINHCRDIIRRSPPPALPLDEVSIPLTEEPEPEGPETEEREEKARSESSATLRRLLGGLKEKHRSILVMRELEGMSYEEIGQALRIPPGTVRSRLNRARASLIRAGEKMKIARALSARAKL